MRERERSQKVVLGFLLCRQEETQLAILETARDTLNSSYCMVFFMCIRIQTIPCQSAIKNVAMNYQTINTATNGGMRHQKTIRMVPSNLEQCHQTFYNSSSESSTVRSMTLATRSPFLHSSLILWMLLLPKWRLDITPHLTYSSV